MSPSGGRLRTLGLAAACVGALAAGGASPAVAQTTTTGTVATTPEVTAAQAGPGSVVEAADRVDIASSLADATAETGVCFGYALELTGGPAGTEPEIVSNAGPNRAPSNADCPKGTVAVEIAILYTSESSESEDRATIVVDSTVPGLSSPTVRGRLEDLGLLDEKSFLGDEDDLAVRNLAAALPLTLDTAVPAPQAAAPAGTAPNGDRLTGSPGSDWLRSHLLTVLGSGAVLAVALVVALGALLSRRATGPTRPRPDA